MLAYGFKNLLFSHFKPMSNNDRHAHISHVIWILTSSKFYFVLETIWFLFFHSVILYQLSTLFSKLSNL